MEVRGSDEPVVYPL